MKEHISALHDEVFMDEEMIADVIGQKASFKILHRDTMFKVDVFIPSSSPFQKSEVIRAQRQTFELNKEVSAKFASAEDTTFPGSTAIVWVQKNQNDSGVIFPEFENQGR